MLFGLQRWHHLLLFCALSSVIAQAVNTKNQMPVKHSDSLPSPELQTTSTVSVRTFIKGRLSKLLVGALHFLVGGWCCSALFLWTHTHTRYRLYNEECFSRLSLKWFSLLEFILALHKYLMPGTTGDRIHRSAERFSLDAENFFRNTDLPLLRIV